MALKQKLRQRIARNIRELAKGRGLTLSQLADLANCGRSSFYRGMSGRGAFSVDTLEKIATVLTVDPSVLLAPGIGIQIYEYSSDGSVKMVDPAEGKPPAKQRTMNPRRSPAPRRSG